MLLMIDNFKYLECPLCCSRSSLALPAITVFAFKANNWHNCLKKNNGKMRYSLFMDLTPIFLKELKNSREIFIIV